MELQTSRPTTGDTQEHTVRLIEVIPLIFTIVVLALHVVLSCGLLVNYEYYYTSGSAPIPKSPAGLMVTSN